MKTLSPRSTLFGSIPTFAILMVLIVVALFNSVRKPLVIWLTVPMALIGVTSGYCSPASPSDSWPSWAS